MAEYNAFAKQKEFNAVFKTGIYKYLLYGGAMGGGKSFNQIMVIIAHALKYPNTRWAIIRRTLVNLKRTSVKTLSKCLAKEGGIDLVLGKDYTFNRQEMIVSFANGSTIDFIEADTSKDPELNKLRGLELDGALIEEANEVDRQVFEILKMRIGRWSEGFRKKAFILLNCNPSQSWVKDVFYSKWRENSLESPFYYLPALPTDNPYISEEQLESFKSLPQKEYEIFVNGNWDFAEDPNQLIKFEWIKECLVDQYKPPKERLTKTMGVDVARYGDDRTVISLFDGKCVYKQLVYQHQDTFKTAEKVWETMRDEGIGYENVFVDSVGVGGGVVDILHNNGFKVGSFSSGESPVKGVHPFYIFRNKKAQLHYYVAELIREGKIDLLKNNELIDELLQIKYEVNERVFSIESKDKAKKRTGKSPDLADSLIMCFAPFLYKTRTMII